MTIQAQSEQVEVGGVCYTRFFIPGEPGPDGSAGGGYLHSQAVAEQSWTVNHGLGYRPAGRVFNSDGDEISASILHVTINQSVVSVSPPITGFARFA